MGFDRGPIATGGKMTKLSGIEIEDWVGYDIR